MSYNRQETRAAFQVDQVSEANIRYASRKLVRQSKTSNVCKSITNTYLETTEVHTLNAYLKNKNTTVFVVQWCSGLEIIMSGESQLKTP